MVSLENQETHSHLLSKKVARRQIKQNINIKLSPDSPQTGMACLKTNNKRCLEIVKRHLQVRCSPQCATMSLLINNKFKVSFPSKMTLKQLTVFIVDLI